MLKTKNSASLIEDLQKEIAALRQENEANQRLASFPQLNPIPVLEFNLNGEVTYLNPAAERVLSQVDQSDRHPFLPEDFSEICRQAREGQALQFDREKQVGNKIYQEHIYFPPGYDTARIYATEITQGRQAENRILKSKQELAQAQDIIEVVTKEADVIIAAIDKDFHYTYFNQACIDEVKRLSGTDIQIGMDVRDCFAHLPEQQQVIQRELSLVLEGKITTHVIRFGDPGIYQQVYNIVHTPLRDAEGNVIGAGQVAYNITEHVRVQEALRESEGRFRLMLRNAPVTIAAQDKDLRFIWAYNQRTYDPETVIGKTDIDLFPPEFAARTMSLKRRVLETGKELNEQNWVTIGGKRVFLDVFVEPIRDDDGQISGVGVATVDLTTIKLIEDALRESEEKYRSLFEAITEGFAIHEMVFDENGEPHDYRFLDINPAFERLTGLTREKVIGKTYRQVLPDEGDGWVSKYGKVVLTGEPVQFEQYSSSLQKYYEIFAYRCAPNQFAVIFMDITSRRLMEDELRINLTKYSVLFDAIPLGVTVSDKNGNIIESNQEAVRLLGLSEEEQNRRKIDGVEWQIIRRDGTPMLPDEFASVRALKEQRRIDNIEMGIVKDGGQVTWISVTAAPIPHENFGVVITYRDISPRIQAEEALRRAHEDLENTVQKRTEELVLQTKAVEAERKRFNDVLEILPAYLVLLTQDYHVAFANRFFRERFGEDHGRTCYDYLFGLSEPCEVCETYKVLRTGKELHWEWVGPDQHNYDVFDFPFTDVDGSTLILEMGIDVTGRKQAEEKLQQLNTYNRRLLEVNLDALVTITPEGKIGDVNAVTETITGYPRQELIGTDFHNYFTDPDKARAGYEQVFETGEVRDYELEIQHKDGHTTPVTYNASIYRDDTGNVAGVFAAARDITERKRAQHELEVLNTALESAANGIILTDRDGIILWSNPAFNQMTGYSKEEVFGKNPRFLKSGVQDREFYRNLWETILSGKVWRGELVNRRKDRSLYYEEQIITPVFDGRGNITNFISIRQDITEHKKAEEALIKSEEQYRSLVLASTQTIWQTNAQGEVIEDLPMWRQLTGQSTEEIMGRGWVDAIHPEDQQRILSIWSQAVQTQTLYDVEYRIKKSTGEYAYFSVRGVPIRDIRGKISGWVGTATDITDKKNYEDQLLQAEKHAAIGRMVGSVTHEINNPLQTIKNCLYLIQQDTGPDSQNKEPLEMALSETQRLSNIVGQLRQLYRPQSGQLRRSYDLMALIQEVRTLLEPHLCNSHVEWQSLPGLQSCNVDCIKDQVIEVLLNISMNAIEAMSPDGGALSVNMIYSTDNTQVGVVLSDTGPGIKPEILPHIFEPFITTKEYGLGLGLSICYGIIQKHGGQITVDSEPGRGTSFTIWLPVIG